jgi:hypothetical protein
MSGDDIQILVRQVWGAPFEPGVTDLILAFIN